MKKPLLIFLFVFCLFFSSCSVTPAEPELNFSCGIKAEYNGEKISAEMVSDKRHMLTVRMDSPAKGCTYSYKDGKIRLSYRNMVVNAEDNYLPNTAFAQSVYNVFLRLYENKYTLSSADNSFAEYKGRSDSGDFVLKTDVKSGKPVSLFVKAQKLTVNFS